MKDKNCHPVAFRFYPFIYSDLKKKLIIFQGLFVEQVAHGKTTTTRIIDHVEAKSAGAPQMSPLFRPTRTWVHEGG